MREWNQTFIIAAYTVTWVVLLGYVLRLARMSRRVRGEYDRMIPGPVKEEDSR